MQVGAHEGRLPREVRAADGLGDRGFTIAELLVAVTLTMLLAGAIFTFQRYQLFALSHQSQQIDLQSSARATLQLFARELREAGLNSTPAFCGIATASANEIRIQSDLNRDGAINGVNEDLTYRYNSSRGALERIDHNNGNRADTLIGDVDEVLLRIRYFANDGTEIAPGQASLTAAQRTAVRRVRVSLTLRDNTRDPNDPSFLRVEAATNVDVRNRAFASMIQNPVCS